MSFASTAPAAEGTLASRDGVEIFYRVEGQGEPALVFVHCWTCDLGFWTAQVAHFAPKHQVISLDLAGHGESGSARRDWTMQAFAEDVRAVVDAVDPRRIVLIGHSMGGPVVLEAAKLMPERVAGIVFVDTLHDVDQVAPPDEAEADVAKFRADYPREVDSFMRAFLFAPSTDPALIERIVGQAKAASPEMALSAMTNLLKYDARPVMAAVKAPIRAIDGDRYPANLEAARRYAPGFEVFVIEGVGHYPMLEDPTRFNALLEQALRSMGVAQ